MSCLRLSGKKTSPPPTKKAAANSPIWCRCHYCRRRMYAGKNRGTIWALKFLNKLGFTRVMHGGYTQGENKEEYYYNSKANGLRVDVVGENNGKIGEDRKTIEEEVDKRLTSSKASSSSTMTSFRLNGVDPIFDEFIEKNRERFKLEKIDSFERSNYYAMWPYISYSDP